jgi:hypothetical protein
MPAADGRPHETRVTDNYEEFWSVLPEKVIYPSRVPVLEAFRWIGEPLSAITTVDVLDGNVSMWEVAYHLRVLEAFDVVEPAPPHAGKAMARREVFDVPYRVKAAAE